MRIVILGSQSSVHVVRWANALVLKGIDVHLVTMHEPREQLHPDVNTIQLSFRSPFGYIFNIPKLRVYLKRIKPDILHVFYAFGHGYLGRMSGFKPLLLSVMGSDVYDDINENWLYKRIIKKNLENASLVCSTSHVMKRQINILYESNDEVLITPFGIDTDVFRPILRQKKNYFSIGTVKFLEKKYGIDILVRSFSKLCRLYPEDNFKLTIIGEGSERKNLEDLVLKLGISNNCDFLGYVSNDKIPDYLSKFDIFVALSRFDSESFGVAVLEASACGLPVVVSNAGGLPEVVQKDLTGLIVPKENVDRTVDAFKRLYDNQELRSTLGKNGRSHVEQKYSWSKSVNQMIEIYSNL